MPIPFDDWQFWVVTLAAMTALWMVIRPLLPRGRKTTGQCAGCPPQQGNTKRARLTVSAHPASDRSKNASATDDPRAP